MALACGAAARAHSQQRVLLTATWRAGRLRPRQASEACRLNVKILTKVICTGPYLSNNITYAHFTSYIINLILIGYHHCAPKRFAA